MQHLYRPYALGLALICTSGSIWAQEGGAGDIDPRAPVQTRRSASQPGPSGGPNGSHRQAQSAVFPLEFRTFNGTDNNGFYPEWGAAERDFVRQAQVAYADGLGSPSGETRPNPRAISQAICAQTGAIPNPLGASDMVWAWGQFIDHDMTETPLADPAEHFDVTVPQGDPYFDPLGTGNEAIPLDRSAYHLVQGRREQVNAITAYLDGSQVYGSDLVRANALRTLDGTGRLRTSAGQNLPFNTGGLPNAPSSDPSFFVAGDVRANEQVLLTALHTVFVREHNWWARRIQALRPFDGETTYQIARAFVTAELQAITYHEFLPALLGPGTLPVYQGYRSDVDGTIANEFATAAFRFGHTMLPTDLRRLAPDGSEYVDGNLALAQAFFRPDRILSDGIEPYLMGASHQVAQNIDPLVVDGVRNFLFGPPGSGGLDLASLNIQRGRDHGLPSFRRVRQAFGLQNLQTWQQLTGPGPDGSALAAALENTYGSLNRLDPWVGFLAERKNPGRLVGRTLERALVEQFTALRDGDRFYYEGYLPDGFKAMVEQSNLATILRRNSGLGAALPDDVFHVL